MVLPCLFGVSYYGYFLVIMHADELSVLNQTWRNRRSWILSIRRNLVACTLSVCVNSLNRVTVSVVRISTVSNTSPRPSSGWVRRRDFETPRQRGSSDSPQQRRRLLSTAAVMGSTASWQHFTMMGLLSVMVAPWLQGSVRPEGGNVGDDSKAPAMSSTARWRNGKAPR